MECSYCGKATGAQARWEVTTGAPGDGMTRYPCDQHLPAACGHVAQVGDVRVLEHNRHRDIPRVGEVARSIVDVQARRVAA